MNKIILLAILLSFSAFSAIAQTGWEEGTGEIEDASVIIEKDRKIELPKASRNFERVPPLPEDKNRTADLDYTFKQIDLSVEPAMPQIRVFTIREEPLDKFYGSYIRVGAGNYLTPYLEFFTNNKRNDVYSAGFHFKHLSSINGPVDKRNSGTSETILAGNARYFTQPLIFSGDIKYRRNKSYFYGYDQTQEVDRDTLKQVFNGIELTLGMEDNYDEDADVSFRFTPSLRYLQDRFDAREFIVGADLSVNYSLSGALMARIEAGIAASQRNDTAGKLSRGLFRLKPTFAYDLYPLKVEGGLNAVFENDTSSDDSGMRFYPFVQATYALLDNISLYGGFGGDVIENYLYDLTTVNPYLAPNVNLLHTNKIFDFYGGVKGSLINLLSYDAGFSIANYQNMYFFVNSAADSTKFSILYDNGNVKMLNLFASLSLSKTELFRADLRADYYGYGVEEVEEPWHKPKYKLSLSAFYNLYDKIEFSGELYAIGGMKARAPVTEETVKLVPALDLNLKIEYLFSDRFSAFISFNNMLSKNYQLYLNYPSRGLLVMGGIGYTF